MFRTILEQLADGAATQLIVAREANRLRVTVLQGDAPAVSVLETPEALEAGLAQLFVRQNQVGRSLVEAARQLELDAKAQLEAKQKKASGAGKNAANVTKADPKPLVPPVNPTLLSNSLFDLPPVTATPVVVQDALPLGEANPAPAIAPTLETRPATAANTVVATLEDHDNLPDDAQDDSPEDEELDNGDADNAAMLEEPEVQSTPLNIARNTPPTTPTVVSFAATGEELQQDWQTRLKELERDVQRARGVLENVQANTDKGAIFDENGVLTRPYQGIPSGWAYKSAIEKLNAHHKTNPATQPATQEAA